MEGEDPRGAETGVDDQQRESEREASTQAYETLKHTLHCEIDYTAHITVMK